MIVLASARLTVKPPWPASRAGCLRSQRQRDRDVGLGLRREIVPCGLVGEVENRADERLKVDRPAAVLSSPITIKLVVKSSVVTMSR